jgi:protein-arginine kinase activator protein McsA
VEDEFDEDELAAKLVEMKRSIVEEYSVEESLTEQLSEAIAAEKYELAAEIRDRIERRNRKSV